MDIIDKIDKQIELFDISFKKPVFIYLGHREWCEMREVAREYCYFNIETHTFEYRGIPMVEVNSEYHLNVA